LHFFGIEIFGEFDRNLFLRKPLIPSTANQRMIFSRLRVKPTPQGSVEKAVGYEPSLGHLQ